MPDLALLVSLLQLALKDRAQLVFENAALRQQLAVYKRSVKRPNIKGGDRVFWMTMMRLLREWKEAVVIVKPETVVRWHRSIDEQQLAGDRVRAIGCRAMKRSLPVGPGRSGWRVLPVRTLVRLVALVAFLPLAGGCASPRPPLQVMTFNVRYANADDGADAWERRKGLVFDVIGRHAPDLVGLQEALPEQMDELRATVPRYLFLGQGREGGRRGEHSALMVRDERLDVVESGDFWLSPTPDEVGSRGWDAALPRMCTWAVLRDRTSGDAFLAMNTHFDHWGREARRESARVILERRKRRAELPLVLTGDLNAGEESPPLAELRAAGLRDTFRDAHAGAEPAGTFNGFRGESGGDKIDYVLVDGGWSTFSAAIVRDHDDGRYPSDHYPVVAELARR